MNKRMVGRSTIVLLAVLIIAVRPQAALSSGPNVALQCWLDPAYEFVVSTNAYADPLVLDAYPFDNIDVLNYVSKTALLKADEIAALRAVRTWTFYFYNATQQPMGGRPQTAIKMQSVLDASLANEVNQVVRNADSRAHIRKCHVRSWLDSHSVVPSGAELRLGVVGKGKLYTCAGKARLRQKAKFRVEANSISRVEKVMGDEKTCSFRIVQPPVQVVNYIDANAGIPILPLVFPDIVPIELASRLSIFAPFNVPLVSPQVGDPHTALERLRKELEKHGAVKLNLYDDEAGYQGTAAAPEFQHKSAVFASPGKADLFRRVLGQAFQCFRDLKAGEEQYVVAPNDSLWRVSKKRYGSGLYFHALADRNGIDLRRGGRLKPGTILTLPSSCPQRSGEVVMVERGDNLSLLIKRSGSNESVSDILRKNPQIQDPDRIYPTQRIRLG